MENLRPGTYKARAIKWALGRAGTGTEQMEVKFQISEGPCSGQQISGFLFFGEKSTQRTLESLGHCGWDGDSLGELRGMGSRDCELVLNDEDYNGKRQLKVQWINAPGGRGMAMHNVMTPAETEAFEQRMRGEMMKYRQSRAQAPAPAPQKDDAEFPFGANAGKKDGPPV